MKYSRIWLFLSCLMPVVLSGCRNDDSNSFENKVFISADSYEQTLRVQRDENVSEMTYGLTVGMAKPLDHDITVVLSMDKELLDNYRHAFYNEDAQLLPDANCNFSSLRTYIVAGSISSEVLSLDFVDLDKLDYKTDYVMPLSIKDASGEEILQSGRTVYVVIKEASLIKILHGLTGRTRLRSRIWNSSPWKPSSMPIRSLTSRFLR